MGIFLLIFCPSSGYACRVSLLGAVSKTNKVNFLYFDNIVLMQATDGRYKRSDVEERFSNSEYTKVRIIKSYKGNLPQEFFTSGSSSAVCGYDFQEGYQYLAFFGAKKIAAGLEFDPIVPFFITGLDSFATSKLIRVGYFLMADKIIESAR